jgi:hypothetical protein
MESIIQFFNNTLPCPTDIPDCEKLRIEYAVQLNDLKRQGGCSKCAETAFKNKFIIKLQELMTKRQ